MADNKLYNKDSIESLSPLEFTRLRPGVYAGDTTYSTQLLVEIVSNAVDEFRLGHGNKIVVEINDHKNSLLLLTSLIPLAFIILLISLVKTSFHFHIFTTRKSN